MNLILKRRNHDTMTPAVRAYAEEKISKVAKVLNGAIGDVEVELYIEKNPSIANNNVAEVTMYTRKGPVIRAKESSTEMHAAIDLVSEKLERQVKKLKGKMVDKHTRGVASMGAVAEAGEPSGLAPEAEERTPDIVKTKVVPVKPMTPEEAALQMELLNHDFFVFQSSETDAISVLYRRKDGDYGLIEPQVG